MDTYPPLPHWADVAPWEEDVELIAHSSNPHLAMTLWSETPYRSRCTRYRARLFMDHELVAVARVLGPGNFDMQDANVMCDIEVHPEHRGQRLSAILVEMLKERIGPIYASGLYSVSGHAASKYLNLPLAPGKTVRISDTVEYSFVDWSTGQFT